jgi:hypothetical protein
MQQAAWPPIFAAVILAGAVIYHASTTQDALPRYAISGVSADGRTAWRIDQLTGRVSICGSLTTGPMVSQLESDRENSALDLLDTMESGGQIPSGQRLADTAQEAEEAARLIRPRCSGWAGG